MNLFKSSADEFEKLRAQARTIDEGLNFLDSKLAHVKTLGLSLEPEKTKKEAEDILQDYAEEMEETKTNVMTYMKSAGTVFEDCKNDNEQLATLINEIQTELQEFETIMRTKEGYPPFELIDESLNNSESRAVIDNNDSNISAEQVSLIQSYVLNEKNETPETKLYHSSIMGSSCGKLLQNTSMPKEAFLSPFNSDNRFSNKTLCSENSNRSICDWLLNTSVAILEKKLNREDDVVRTPVDPGVSSLTMQLLGKSNVKTKVFRKSTFHSTQSDKENEG